jgi:hypothetical protein
MCARRIGPGQSAVARRGMDPMKVAQYEVLGKDTKRYPSRSGRVVFSEREPNTSYWATFIGSLRDYYAWRTSLCLMFARMGGRKTATANSE